MAFLESLFSSNVGLEVGGVAALLTFLLLTAIFFLSRPTTTSRASPTGPDPLAVKGDTTYAAALKGKTKKSPPKSKGDVTLPLNLAGEQWARGGADFGAKKRALKVSPNQKAKKDKEASAAAAADAAAANAAAAAAGGSYKNKVQSGGFVVVTGRERKAKAQDQEDDALLEDKVDDDDYAKYMSTLPYRPAKYSGGAGGDHRSPRQNKQGADSDNKKKPTAKISMGAGARGPGASKGWQSVPQGGDGAGITDESEYPAMGGSSSSGGDASD
eukprot:NODE_2703_length_1058_cov_89.054509_g2253_i0.p1 GENE.NODE_2703_length_1058_cov_89.054509_g2253_i0~~NODE_2703_length_1058_cov_89.054509_g2253_i0.p1  ORF type:complete len:271 (+),score=83.51 NODE_2703_length_1058_cov_89.054509_g2253_i0:130-942(+)